MNPVRIRVSFSILVAVYVLVGLAFLSLPAFAEGLQPGDAYHLFFVTDGMRDATSTDIADYNAFVRAEAETRMVTSSLPTVISRTGSIKLCCYAAAATSSVVKTTWTSFKL